MKIKDIINVIEEYAPKRLASDFDNVGLLLGNKETEVTSVLTTLDVTMQVAREAAELGANLIVTHHPLIFSPQKAITADTYEGEIILYLLSNNIAVYAAHTNMDSTCGGINDKMAQMLNLSDVKTLQPHPEGMGIGRVGKTDTTLEQLCQKIMTEFKVSALRFTGEKTDKVSKVALCSGSGSDDELIFAALNAGADVYITGEIKYHHALECTHKNLKLIELCHYESENIAAGIFADILKESFKDINVTVSKYKNMFDVAFKE